MFICIAGKNQCSIDVIKILAKHKINKKNIFILPNSTDKGRDTWQPSLKKYALKNKFKIVKLDELYEIKDLIFFSLEYEKIKSDWLCSSGAHVNKCSFSGRCAFLCGTRFGHGWR